MRLQIDDNGDVSAPHCETIVIGAGAAGLAAAAHLIENGARSVAILEARDRIGGRVWTLREPGIASPIELGAEFIHGRVPATFEALGRAGLTAIDAPETHWMRSGGTLRRMNDALFKEIQRSLTRSGVSRKKDCSFAEFLTRSARLGLSPTGRRFAQTMVEGFDAADPARVSAHSIAEEWRSGGAADSPQFRPFGGYGALMESLALRIQDIAQLRLRTVVEQISWQRGRVEVSGRFVNTAFTLTADRAIVTLPLGVLLQGMGAGRPSSDQSAQTLPDAKGEGSPGAVRFSPALDAKIDSLQGLASGPVIKVCMRFARPLWETLAHGKYADASFFHSPGTSFPTFWTALPLRVPLLVAWVGGPRAAQLSAQPPEVIVEEALSSLVDILGLKGALERRLRAGLEETWYHDWQSDPFARGAYSYVVTGGKNARRSLAKSIEDTLFFAGEATDASGEAGTVAGALQSGTRAARKILAKR